MVHSKREKKISFYPIPDSNPRPFGYQTATNYNLSFFSELFKAKTLEFFSKTLPILKADDTLPKVARYEDNHISQNPTLFHSKPGSRITFYHHRTSRSVQDDSEKEEALNDESKKVNSGAQCGKMRNSQLLKKKKFV